MELVTALHYFSVLCCLCLNGFSYLKNLQVLFLSYRTCNRKLQSVCFGFFVTSVCCHYSPERIMILQGFAPGSSTVILEKIKYSIEGLRRGGFFSLLTASRYTAHLGQPACTVTPHGASCTALRHSEHRLAGGTQLPPVTEMSSSQWLWPPFLFTKSNKPF